MSPTAQQPPKKHWYKVSVDALKGWAAVLSVAALAVIGFWGYRQLERHLLVREANAVIGEARELVERVRNEEGISTYRSELETARKSLAEAERLFADEEHAKALRNAERSRTLLSSIYNALRHRGSAGEAQFIAVQGEVEYRRGERGDWRPARSRVALYAGDYVKTSRQASAELMTVDGTVYTIRSDTVILVDKETTSQDGASKRRIALEYGWVNLSTSNSAGTVATPAAEAVVERESQAVVAYDEAQKVGRFATYRGSMQVATRDGSTREVKALQQVVQTPTRLSAPASLPGAPEPLEPSDNLEVSMQRADRLVLSWQPVDGARLYALQVSRNRLFADNIIDVQNRTATRATLGIRGEGSFVWRVAALGDQGAMGPWSSPRKFRVTSF